MLALFTILHFLVDGLCGAALAVYAVNEPFMEPIVYYFGLYSAFAFGSQWFVGWLFDRKPAWLRGCFLVSAFALAAGSVPSLGIGTQAALLGTGNSIFHAAAGSLVLQQYDTYKEPGIFVSSGAIGLALGLNRIVGTYPFLLACVVLSVIVTGRLRRMSFAGGFHNVTKHGIIHSNMIRTQDPVQRAALQSVGDELSESGSISGDSLKRKDSLTGAAIVSLFLLLGCVVLRGLGSGSAFSPYVMLFPCVFAAGKALGGLLCDKAGYKKTILFIFLLCFAALHMSGLAAAALLVFAFNMTMPLTLRLAHWCNPRYPGLMFGLAAGCLLPGVFYRGFSLAPHAMVVLQFLCLVAAGYLLWKQAGKPELEGEEP